MKRTNYIFDQVESFEQCAEKRYDEMEQLDGRLKCDCGTVFNPEIEGGTLSPNPWSMPVCNNCLSKAFGV